MPRDYVVPAALVDELAQLVSAGLLVRSRRDGAQPSRAAETLLAGLYQAAHSDPPPRMSPKRPTFRGSSTVEISTTEAAAILGCTTRHVQRLCRTGALRHRRVGRVLLINRASLDHWRYNRRTPDSCPNQPAGSSPPPTTT